MLAEKRPNSPDTGYRPLALIQSAILAFRDRLPRRLAMGPDRLSTLVGEREFLQENWERLRDESLRLLAASDILAPVEEFQAIMYGGENLTMMEYAADRGVVFSRYNVDFHANRELKALVMRCQMEERIIARIQLTDKIIDYVRKHELDPAKRQNKTDGLVLEERVTIGERPDGTVEISHKPSPRAVEKRLARANFGVAPTVEELARLDETGYFEANVAIEGMRRWIHEAGQQMEETGVKRSHRMLLVRPIPQIDLVDFVRQYEGRQPVLAAAAARKAELEMEYGPYVGMNMEYQRCVETEAAFRRQFGNLDDRKRIEAIVQRLKGKAS